MNASNDTQQLRAIFETAIDCLIIIDSRGMISKINPSGAALFGYKQEELRGEKVNILMPFPHRKNHDAYLEKYEKTGKTNIIGIGREVIAIKKDGSLFPCDLSVSEFFVQSERYYAGIIHDLTGRKEAEGKIMELNRELKKKVESKTSDLSSVVKELMESNLRLEREILERKRIENALRNSELEIRKALEKERELNDLKSRFVSMASHEFRTPLSTILSSTVLIEKYTENGLREKTEKHFNRVRSSIKHLTEILDDFLSLSKLEEGKIRSTPERFYFKEFCQEFVEEITGLLKAGQEVVCNMEDNSSEILLDKKLLRNILLNIFSNAIKYSDEKQKIFCGAKIMDNQLIINIKDQGIGIPKNEQKHLFSRFYRGSNAINIKGTGLGLNIVKEYLSMLDGKISFVSEVNRGTTFKIEIPINQGSPSFI